MIRYHFDLYPRDDPRDGTRVVRFTKLQSAEYRGEANGTGAGRFSIRADTAEAQNIDPAGLQYVRVVREDTVAETELVVGGFFLDSGDFTALDERGTRLLTFGGAGTLSYLARAVMWSHTYVGAAGALSSFGPGGQDPFDDKWRSSAHGIWAGGQYMGAMLWRWVSESLGWQAGAYTHRHGDGETYTDTHDDDRTQTAVPFLTLGFTGSVDSSGAAWTKPSGGVSVQVGDSVLLVAKRLMEAGLYVSMDPDTFELNAWESDTHRRDRTGASWGASVIRFQAPTAGDITTGNVKSDANRAISAFIKRSILLAGGQDTYGTDTGTTDIPWEGHYYSDTQDVAALENIAGVQLGARDDAGDTLRLRGRLGNDPANGYYLPFEHVLLDDLGTIHTGTGQWDYNEQDFPVAAITLQLRPGGDWDVWYDMGSSFSATERRFQVTPVPAHNHGPNPRLCDPAVPATAPTEFVNWTWSETDGSGNAVQTIGGGVSGQMNNGSQLQPNPYYRSGSAGIELPQVIGGGSAKLECTAGEAFSFSALIGNRISGLTNVLLSINWYNSGGGLIGSDALFNGNLEGVVPFHPIDTTLTPPTGATGWTVFIKGTLDNVVASTGSGTDAQNPLHGTSPNASRCDHTHIEQMARAPGANDDASSGYPIGTLWLSTASNTLYVSTDDTTSAAVWVQTSLGPSHALDPDAHLLANYAATAAPAATDDSDAGYGVGSVWVDITNDNVYIATDVTVSAANWEQVNGGGGGGVTDHGALTGLTPDDDHTQYVRHFVQPTEPGSPREGDMWVESA